MIALTPRQRQTYDAAYAVTEGGKVRWTGVLKVAGVDHRDVQSDMGRLFDLHVLHWVRIGNSRRIEILVHPDQLETIAPPPERHQGKLHNEPAIGKSPGYIRGAPRSHVDGDAGSAGFRADSGAFSKAFKAAFPNRDYRGVTPC